MTDLRTRFPLGSPVRKISGPEWAGVIVGYYSSTLTQPYGVLLATRHSPPRRQRGKGDGPR